IFLATSYEGSGTHTVSRRCFHPTPAVDSVLLCLDRRPEPFLFTAETRTLIRHLFTRRRKQLATLAKAEESETRDRLETWLARENLSPTLRPEQVVAENWHSL
ncbi:MAG: rRNA adenine N-6-methyltransferase family protein, partial [Opitutales bacterium]